MSDRHKDDTLNLISFGLGPLRPHPLFLKDVSHRGSQGQGQRLLQLHTAPCGSFRDLHLHETWILDYALQATFKTGHYDRFNMVLTERGAWEKRRSQPTMGTGFSKEHYTQISQ